MLFLYLPLLVIVLQAFGSSPIPGWPIAHYSTRWFRLAWNDPFARTAFENSVTLGLLASALSFDEVVVTLFTAGTQQTLPLWIYNQFRLPNTAAEVNAVAVFVILLTAIPVYLAQRLMRDTGGIAGR